jgi:TonB family protein
MKVQIRNLLIILLFSSSFLLVKAQSKGENVQALDTSLAGNVFTIVEEMPMFPGGEDKMFDFIKQNMKYPGLAITNRIKGFVYVHFVVDKRGKIRNARVIRGIGGGCDEEALRVVSLMPDWIAGKQNGKPANVEYNIPVNFGMEERNRSGKN